MDSEPHLGFVTHEIPSGVAFVAFQCSTTRFKVQLEAVLYVINLLPRPIDFALLRKFHTGSGTQAVSCSVGAGVRFLG
jgi:hypothetical protein